MEDDVLHLPGRDWLGEIGFPVFGERLKENVFMPQFQFPGGHTLLELIFGHSQLWSGGLINQATQWLHGPEYRFSANDPQMIVI